MVRPRADQAWDWISYQIDLLDQWFPIWATDPLVVQGSTGFEILHYS